MTTRNSILLILKQSPGIEFNALLAKISSNYGNLNSARAALSRAVKDLSARGLVKKHGKKIFPTDKGRALLGMEMKSKLILRLNAQVKHRNALENIDRIVPLLSTLIERSKQDTDLLKAARGNTSFFVRDIADLKTRADSRVQQLSYLCSVLEQHITSLQNLNFSDLREIPWNPHGRKVLTFLFNQSNTTEFLVECLNQKFLEKVKRRFLQAKQEGKSLFLSQKECLQLLHTAERSISFSSNPINLYVGSVKVQLNYPNMFFTGPFKELEKLEI